MSCVADVCQMKVRVNMNPSVFLPGNHEAAIAEAERGLDIAQRRDNTSVGALLPFDADPNIVMGVSRFIEKS